MTKHYRERRHCWAIEYDSGRLMGFAFPVRGIHTSLYATRNEAREMARLGGGRPVKVQVKYEVID